MKGDMESCPSVFASVYHPFSSLPSSPSLRILQSKPRGHSTISWNSNDTRHELEKLALLLTARRYLTLFDCHSPAVIPVINFLWPNSVVSTASLTMVLSSMRAFRGTEFPGRRKNTREDLSNCAWGPGGGLENKQRTERMSGAWKGIWQPLTRHDVYSNVGFHHSECGERRRYCKWHALWWAGRHDQSVHFHN